MTDHDQLLEMVPLYALHALTAAETQALEVHLETCDVCRIELDEHHKAAAALIGDEPAPAGVWEQIVAEIEEPAATVTDLGARSRTRARQWVAVVATAAAAAIFAGILLEGRGNDGLLEETSVMAAAEQASDLEDSIVADFLVDDVSVARIILTSDGQGFVVPTAALEPLDASRTYQLWVVNTDSEAISAGAIGNDPTASTFTWTGDVAGFALTRELAGGVVSSEGDVVSLITEL